VADDDFEVQASDEPAQSQQRSRSMRPMLLLGLLGAGAVWVLMVMFSSPDEQPASGEQGQQTEAVDPEEQEQREQAAEEAEEEVDDVLGVEGPSTENAIQVLDEEVRKAQKQRSKLTKELDGLKSTITDLERRLKEVADRQKEAISQRAVDRRRGAAPGDDEQGEAGEGEDLPAPPEDGEAPSEPQTEEFPYTRLGARSGGQGGQGGGGDGDGEGSDQGPDVATPAGQSGQFPGQDVGDQSVQQSLPGEEGERGAIDAGAEEVDEARGTEGGGDVTDSEQSQSEEIIIPAASMARATNLHGVSCPVVNSNIGGTGELADQRMPVILPITGKFKGPNGDTHDIGQAHLIGLCEGIDGERPRGRIKIEQLSLVGSDGEPQFIEVSGYIVDARDNRQGAWGTLESRQGSRIAAAAAAASIEGLADVVGQTQTDSAVTEEGTVLQSLSSANAPAAAGGAAVESASEEVANYYSDLADREIPVVQVQANVPMQFFTTQPITYEREAVHDDFAQN